MNQKNFIINPINKILITGANGFIGTRVVKTLLEYGFSNLRCFVRPTGNLTALKSVLETSDNVEAEIFKGNLLSSEDCMNAARDVDIIYHLAAGVEKTFPGCFLNSAVTTRNLLEAVRKHNRLKRFLNVSSFAVYSLLRVKRGDVLDETCEIEPKPHLRGDAYGFGKIKQDALLQHYGEKYKIPYVIVRPGAVYGPGKNAISGRIGIDTFGFFMHMGGSNKIPLTYIDNCAEAIVLAGITHGLDGEIFNIVDDDLPESREFLQMYKKNVATFSSITIHPRLSYLPCFLWEKYSQWTMGQLPPAFNRRRWAAEWKGHQYSNLKLKKFTGWQPRVSTREGLARFFKFAKESGKM